MHKFTSFIILIFAFTFFTSTVYAVSSTNYSGYSISELTELITKLTKQLEELKKNSSAQCFVSEKILSLGDGETGDGLSGDVEKLQSFLREKGYFTYSKNTGFFGKVTKNALTAFQNEYGLFGNGEFDSATKAKIHAMSCTKTISKIKNEVKTETKKVESKTIGSLSSITASVSGSKVSWISNGYSKNGFKIVWSKNINPTYPTRSGDKYIYLSDPSSSSTYLESFDGSGTYYVRVCEYLGGSCGVYSNELKIEL